MSMALKEAREKSGTIGQEIKTLAERANDPKHDWSAEDQTEWDRVNAAFDKNAENVTRLEEVAARMSAVDEKLNPARGTRFGQDDQNGGDNDEQRQTVSEQDRLETMQGWLRAANGLDPKTRHVEAAQRVGVKLGSNELRINALRADYEPCSEGWVGPHGPVTRSRFSPNPEARAGLNVGTAADGGYTIPEGFQNELEKSLLQFGGMRRVARILRTATGNDLPWPTVDDTGNTGELLGEATTIGASVDPTFAVKTLNAYKYSSKPILISSELLEDSAFNLGQIVPQLLGERVGRITNTHFTTGDGSAKPNGIVTATSVGKTTASATAITAQELIDLEHSVDPAYRDLESVGYMFHDNVLASLRKLVDGDSRPLWAEGMSGGIPNRINNRPYVINQDMSSTIASTDITAVFGAFEKYVIRDVSNMRLLKLVERYADLDQAAFVLFSRHDGELINADAIKHLLQAT